MSVEVYQKRPCSTLTPRCCAAQEQFRNSCSGRVRWKGARKVQYIGKFLQLHVQHLQGGGIAAAAGAAVEEVVHAAHAADAACRTVELLLGGVVLKEAALEACVCPKGHPAANAGRADRLAQRAQCADDLTDPCPVQLMPLAGVLQNNSYTSDEQKSSGSCPGKATLSASRCIPACRHQARAD